MHNAVALLLGLAILGLPLAAESQQATRVWRVAVLTADRPGAVEALVEGLRELNYVEGRNLVVEHRRFLREEELPLRVAEIVQSNPDVIVTGHGIAALALKAATRTIPIVMSTSSDAVGQGIIASLARPGGNVTGFTNMATQLTAKRLEVLLEAAPHAVRIAVLGCETSGRPTSGNAQWLEVRTAAQGKGLTLVPVLVRSADELPGAFESAMRKGIDAVLVLECSVFPRAERVVAVVNKARVAAVYPVPRYAPAGGLMVYGPNTIEQYRRSAIYVDRILRGTRPADLPVEQPALFEFIVNAGTAKALGLTLPRALLLRADKVIE